MGLDINAVNDWPQTKFSGCLSTLHLIDTEATVWLGM